MNALAYLNQNAKQFKDGRAAFPLGETLHGRFNKVEGLLEVVEADCGVDSVPVQHFVFKNHRLAQMAINVFLVEDVEHRLEQL